MTRFNRSDFEIMAPVGSWESLQAALRSGADAVYFGVRGLNMRNGGAANFEIDDLPGIMRLCRQVGVKAYLTVNTIIYDAEMDHMERVLDAAVANGIDAVIVSDIAAITGARRRGLEVHISTQCNISNTEAVRFYSQWADVVVLARELSLGMTAAISRAIADEPITGPSGRPVRIEMFCHGALCMAVSGKCYMSLHEMNRSANRGACGQICRRGYKVTDLDTGHELVVDNQYIMSPKDLCTIGMVDKMVNAGVRVFKIEGRARGAEYVSATVGAYDRALRALCDGTYTPQLARAMSSELQKVFNRGFWEGYYAGRPAGEWSARYGSSATRVKHYVAKTVKWFPRLGVGEFIMEAGEICQGDELLLIGPSSGSRTFRAGELRVDLLPVAKVVKGDRFSMPVPDRVRPSDKLYLWVTVRDAD